MSHATLFPSFSLSVLTFSTLTNPHPPRLTTPSATPTPDPSPSPLSSASTRLHIINSCTLDATQLEHKLGSLGHFAMSF